MDKIAFVTGGTGFLGGYLVKKLIQRGFKVKVLVRDPAKFLIKDSCEIIIGDIRNPELYVDKISDCNYVFHLAGVVTDWAPKKDYFQINVEGTRKLLEIFKNKKLERFLYISTIDVLDKFRKDILDESCVYTQSKNYYCYTKSLAEGLVFSYSHRYNMKVSIIIPAWIYGIGDTTLIPELYYQLKKRGMVYISSKDVVLPLVHVDNLANAIIDTALSDKTINESLLISDGEMTWENLCKIICNKYDFLLPVIVIPYKVAHYLGLLMEVIYIILKIKQRPLLTRTAVEMLGVSIKLDASKSNRLISYKPFISLINGINDYLVWLDNHKFIRYK